MAVGVFQRSGNCVKQAACALLVVALAEVMAMNAELELPADLRAAIRAGVESGDADALDMAAIKRAGHVTAAG